MDAVPLTTLLLQMPDNKIENRQNRDRNIPRTVPSVRIGLRKLDERRNAVGTRFKRANLSGGIYQHTGDERSFSRAASQWREIGEISNQIRGREEMQALMRTTFDVREDKDGKRTGTIIDDLPELDHLIPKDREPQRMRDIIKRLNKTLSVIDQEGDNMKEIAKRFRGKSSYVIVYGSTYMLDRSLIGQDIRWLSEPFRIGDINRPGGAREYTEREKMFIKYRDILLHIKDNLTTPAAEHSYVTEYGDDTGNEKLLRNACRDPDSVKGAGKFALLLAVSALLALWVIRDIKKGTISFGTLLLIGAAMFLAQSGPKNAFMGSKQFADLSRRIGREGVEKLQTMRPSARNHLIATLKDRSGRGGITEENLHLLTEPKTKSGRPINSKRVDEDIARMFIGDPNPEGAAYVLERMAGVRDGPGREVMGSLADANHKSNRAHKELTQIQQNLPAHQEAKETQSPTSSS